MGECFFWYRPTRVVPDQRPLNGRCCCCCCIYIYICIYYNASFGTPVIPLTRTKLDISNLVCRLSILSTTICMLKLYSRGCIQGHVTSQKYWEISTVCHIYIYIYIILTTFNQYLSNVNCAYFTKIYHFFLRYASLKTKTITSRVKLPV